MKSSNEVVLSRPKSFWERSLKLKKGDFFKSLLKVAINTVSSSLVPSPSSFVGSAQSAVDLLFSFSFKDQDPKKEEVAWLLISRSLALALHELVIETTSQFKLQKLEELTPTLEQFAEEADTYLDSLETSIDLDFFNHPERLSLLESVKEKLTEWLEKAGLSSYNAEAISDRLPAYFVFALNIEWQNRSSEYEVLKQLETPFTKAAEREQAWRKYYATLQKEVSKKVFDENFGLKQIYQPLRAFYPPQNHSESRHRQQKATNPADPPKKKVVDLEKKLLAWLETNDQREAIKVLCGGPGSGKSSFAKVFAANRDLQDRRKVVLIPLHRFTFTEDLSDAVGNFVAAYGLNNPIDLKDPEKGLLIIFDGLDELALSGKVGAETARGFISEVRKKVDSAYSKEIPIKILITSRDLVIQANIMEFRQQNQILHLIPYYEPNQTNYNDPENLLKKDYRDDWWRKFGELKGKIYDGIPEKLKEGKLGEVTAQPLLNYLVSLSFERGEIDFSKNSNINEIYEDLFKSVYDRDWEKRLHPGARSLEFDDFHLFFEEVAISAWHGDGRKTSEEEIKKNCKKSGIDLIFEQFQSQTEKSDLTNLLTAFYIRESDSRNSKNDKTFEFTHKSFSEYLTAKHILRQLKATHEECEERKEKRYKKGWDEQKALEEWAELFGKTPIDEYLFDFLASEIDRCDTEMVKKWQQTLCDLISFMLREGMPMQNLGLSTFQEMNKQARNAEEALLIVLNACARKTRTVSKIDLDNEKPSFASWLLRLRADEDRYEQPFFTRCLSFLDLQQAILWSINLSGANLSGAVLSGANLSGAVLSGAYLSGANLSGANLSGADLSGAVLSEADLSGAVLSQAYLSGANLSEADLFGADLSWAVLSGANLSEAYLSGAVLSQANLSRAYLSGANLSGAVLSGAYLSGANLVGAVLINEKQRIPVTKDVLSEKGARFDDTTKFS